MIYKTLSRHKPSYGSLIGYIFKDSKADGHEPIIFTQNIRSRNRQDWEKEFIQNEVFRHRTRSDQVYLYHDIISFSDKDAGNISDEALINIGNEYMRLRGKEGIYIGAVHRDKNHAHIHFAVSALKFRTGDAHRMTRAEFQELKIKLQEFQRQKHPELEHSIARHGRGKEYVTDREWQLKHRTGRTLKKEELQQEIQITYSRSATQKEFLESLREQGIHYYERNGIPTGVIYGDMKFRFSRLGLSKEDLAKLPPDYTQEQRTLDEIRKLRSKISERTRDDIDFEIER